MLITVFMKVLDMTKAASIVILLVLLARLLLKKAPKVFSYALWAVVLFRLLCPVSIEAPTSILPEITPVSDSYTLAEVPISPVNAGVAAYQAVGDAINGGLGVQHIRTELPDENGGSEYVSSMWWEVWVLFGQYAWLAGMAAMAVYAVVSYIKIRRKLITASPLRKNIFLADEITSPFVMGLIRPKIYLPSSMDEQEQSYILLHEQHHIRRLDHIFKALGFLALCIHWFNPLVWVAFILAGKDMEMSCDEAVVKKMGEDIRADYTASLLSLATGKRIIAGTPLAFGEGDTKGRIHNLANWKKPKIWIILLSILLCLVLGICLLTNPTAHNFPMTGTNISDLEPEQLTARIAKIHNLDDPSALKTNAGNFELQLDSGFCWMDSPAIRYFYTQSKQTYSAQLRIFPDQNEYYVTEPGEWIEQNTIYLFQLYLEALKYLPQDSIKAMSPNADSYMITMVEEGNPGSYDRVLTYTPDGAGDIDGWFIHLQVAPLQLSADGGYFGQGEEVIHLFYDRDNGTYSTELIPGTTYVPYQCIYMNLASSYYPFGGDSGFKYIIGDGFFAFINRDDGNIINDFGTPLEDTGSNVPNTGYIDVPEWKWQPFPYSDDEWANLFLFSLDSVSNFSGQHDEILYQPINSNLFLLRVDGSIWLVDLSEDGQGRPYIWSIYSLVPESAMGVAQWESAPMLSSRSPVFPFQFDMDYTHITATCTHGVLTEFNYGEVSDKTLTIPAGKGLYWAPVMEDLPDSGITTIRFTVYNGEEMVCAGTLYIESTSARNNGRTIYTASLVGTGLHLSSNPDYEGGIITLINGGSTVSVVEHDLTAGKLETTVERLGQYIFFTNSTQIKVTVKGGSDFTGTIRLLDISQGNAEIAIKEISKAIPRSLSPDSLPHVSTGSNGMVLLTVRSSSQTDYNKWIYANGTSSNYQITDEMVPSR